jgi:2,4-dienoyl-CoA reductase-like NADH-dependent reductase (Old Yellow Enzyme family)
MSQIAADLFDAVTFGNGVVLRNRIVMAPMTTWAGDPDASPMRRSYFRRGQRARAQ